MQGATAGFAARGYQSAVSIHAPVQGATAARRANARMTNVFLCMLAYYVEFHMRRRLAPILFDDHDRAAAAAERKSIVAPAKRSPGPQF